MTHSGSEPSVLELLEGRGWVLKAFSVAMISRPGFLSSAVNGNGSECVVRASVHAFVHVSCCSCQLDQFYSERRVCAGSLRVNIGWAIGIRF